MSAKSRRYRTILATLARHGFAALDQDVFKDSSKDQVRAIQLRLVCEELGTMFIKLGQMLSTRSDILSEPYRVELSKLQSDVPPVPTSEIATIIEQSLNGSPETLFASFQDNALGSASIGQVHAATTKDGKDVVVKVKKPGVDEEVTLDLEIVDDLIVRFSHRFPVLIEYNARPLLRDFGQTLREEMQYPREVANLNFFRNFFSDNTAVAIPMTFDALSRGSVITEQRMQGTGIADTSQMTEAERKALATSVANFVLEPAFKAGTFHADPHAGNFLVQQDGILAVLDFGKVGRLTSQERRSVALVFSALNDMDAHKLTDNMLVLTHPDHPIDRQAMIEDVDRLLAKYGTADLGAINFGGAVNDLLVLVRKNHLYLPGHLVLLFKALVMSEGLLEQLDPSASFQDYLKPLMGKVLLETFGGKDQAKRFEQAALDTINLMAELPGLLQRVLTETERGNLRVWTKIEDADSLMKRLEHLVARTNATILAAATIIGLSVLLQIYHPHRFQSWIGIVFWIFVGSVLIDYLRTLWNLRK